MARLRKAWATVADYAVRRWARLHWHLRRWLTLRRFRTVVLVGMYAPYNEDYGGKADVWGCNFTYRHESRLDRLFAMDSIEDFKQKDPQWVEEVNATGLPVVMQRACPEVPRSSPFPLDAVRREVCSRDYYTSTIAYMYAEAIRLGYGAIVIHRLMVQDHSDEYVEQKACLDWWCGVAFGLGINVVLSEDCQLVRPYPWQSALYGYITQDNWLNAAKMMGSTMHAISRMDRTFRKAA